MENSLLEQLYPLHPKLVHFPIALFVSAMGIQMLGLFFKKDSWCKGAWLMFVLAVLSLPIAIFSGILEASRLHLHHPVLNEHRMYAFWATGTAWIALPLLWLMRSKNVKFFQAIFLIILISLSVLIGLTAREGGEMVWEYGVGVNR